MKKIFYSFLIIAFFFISASLFGEETGLQVGNAGEGGGTFTFYDVVFGNGMIGILIWMLLFVVSTAALAITIRCAWNLQKRFSPHQCSGKTDTAASEGSGHCGIVAHDGRIISGGEFNVNRRKSEINKTLRKM